MSVIGQGQELALVVTCGDCRLHESVRWYMRDHYQILRYYLYALPGSFLAAHPKVNGKAPSEQLVLREHLDVYLSALAHKQPTGPIRVFAFYHVSEDDQFDDCAGWYKLNGLVGLEGEDCWREAACGIEKMSEEILHQLGLAQECEILLHRARISDNSVDIGPVEGWLVLNAG